MIWLCVELLLSVSLTEQTSYADGVKNCPIHVSALHVAVSASCETEFQWTSATFIRRPGLVIFSTYAVVHLRQCTRPLMQPAVAEFITGSSGAADINTATERNNVVIVIYVHASFCCIC